jgi:ABC-type hemin transport system substrate-binding protein
MEYERPIATVACNGGHEEMVLLLVQREGGEPEFYVDGRSFNGDQVLQLLGGLQAARGLVAGERQSG